MSILYDYPLPLNEIGIRNFYSVINIIQVGRVDKWLKKEGDWFDTRDPICIVTVSEDLIIENYNDVQVEIDAHSSGIIAKIMVNAGDIIPVHTPIAMFLDNKQEYLEYLEGLRLAQDEVELIEEMKPLSDEGIKATSKILMREIRHIMKKCEIDTSSDFAKELQNLARKGNSDLLSVFEASFDGKSFNEETFDMKFFLDNATEIVNESLEVKRSQTA